jgi:LytS/YehU family sensor histidine kinase
MITRLARLLRSTLRNSRETTVPLGDELDLVRTCLDLEGVRLEDRLTYALDAEHAPHACASRPNPETQGQDGTPDVPSSPRKRES